MRDQMSTLRWSPLGCALALMLTGCSPSTGTITGRVLYDGKPLPAGTVTFITSDNQPHPATISQDGTYKVEKVPPGTVKITVSVPSGPKGMPDFLKGGLAKGGLLKGLKLPEGVNPYSGATAKPPVVIPSHYAEADKSGLTYTVQAGSQTHDIELHSDQKK